MKMSGVTEILLAFDKSETQYRTEWSFYWRLESDKQTVH